MKRYLILILLIIVPILACDTEGTIYEHPEDTRAVIQSDQDCNDCTLESK